VIIKVLITQNPILLQRKESFPAEGRDIRDGIPALDIHLLHEDHFQEFPLVLCESGEAILDSHGALLSFLFHICLLDIRFSCQKGFAFSDDFLGENRPFEATLPYNLLHFFAYKVISTIGFPMIHRGELFLSVEDSAGFGYIVTLETTPETK
jgi:hypothetical protein